MEAIKTTFPERLTYLMAFTCFGLYCQYACVWMRARFVA